MSDVAQPRPCTACGKPVLAVVVGLCPDCEKDSAFYKATRKKGDKREFLPYPELLEQWRRRRAECREWKKVAEQAANDRAAREQAEQERAQALAVLHAAGIDPNPALALAAELDKARAELERERALAAYWRQRAEELQAGKPDRHEALLQEFRRLQNQVAFPPEQWRRLVQLAHPDKHGDSPAALEATRWLMENRP